MEAGKKIVVSQVKSLSGRTEPERETLRALGLGRIGKKRAHTVNPAIWGMLKSVRHLIQVVEAK